jgi:HK97 gp10 family phage protein
MDEHITGMSELLNAMDAFGPLLQKKMMRGAVRAGAKLMKDEAVRGCPVAPPTTRNAKYYGTRAGELRDSIRISTVMRGTWVTATIKAGSGKAYYAHMVEFGTAEHLIDAKPGYFLAMFGSFKKRVLHPGATKKPFMRPALDVKSAEAISRFAANLQTRMDKQTIKDLAAMADEVDEVVA